MSTSQIAMLGLAIVGLTIVMLSTRGRVRRSRQSSSTTVRQRYTQLQEEKKTARGVEEVMLELDQLARQIHGRLDTRLAKLEAVIRDADQRIDKLSRLIRVADGRPALDVTLKEEDPHQPHPSNSDVEESRYAAVHRLADGGLRAVEIAREVGKTTGEIELILALRKAKQQADDPPVEHAAHR